jgi:hypothetical protein
VSHWLKDVIIEGMTMLDVEDALAAQGAHFAQKGEWRKGVISPSLVSVNCPLQRVKIFLGLDPVPGVAPRMATKAGRPDPVSLVSMVRGFDAEALVLAAIRKAMPTWVIDAAPTFEVDWVDTINGYHYAGHPDVLGYQNSLELVQIKCPSVFKLERVEKLGDDDALASYMPQMVTEMFIARKAGIPVERNHLVLFSPEGTPKQNTPRIYIATLEWEESMATIPEQAAREIHDAAAQALVFNRWPEAYPKTSWDVWPCGYCRYARLGDLEVPACDDHEKWRSNVQGTNDHDEHGGGPGVVADGTGGATDVLGR